MSAAINAEQRSLLASHAIVQDRFGSADVPDTMRRLATGNAGGKTAIIERLDDRPTSCVMEVTGMSSVNVPD